MDAAILTLTFPDLATPEATHHLVRAELGRRRPKQLHDHQFYELLWVQNGTLRHHTAAETTDLAEGTMLFMRPNDAHALQGKGEAAMIVSLSIRTDAIETLGQRHPELTGHGFWSPEPAPKTQQLDMRQLAALNHAALRLEQGRPIALTLEAFLLPLMADLVDGDIGLPQDAPGWLHRACAAARDPVVFSQGAAGFVTVSGRAHPHVARSLRRYLNMTPSDFINQQRMLFAARRLTGSQDTLSEIASDCGIPNLSHFHKLFLAHHKMTPQRYRRAHRLDLIQP